MMMYILIGVAALLLIVLVVICCVCCKRKSTQINDFEQKNMVQLANESAINQSAQNNDMVLEDMDSVDEDKTRR